jgi:hypothetical protein
MTAKIDRVRDIVGVLGCVLIAAGATGKWGWAVAAMIVGVLLLGLVVAGSLRR